MDIPPGDLVIDPQTNIEKLAMLLNLGHEFSKLDYKRVLDLRETSAKVELAKDIGAMSLDGGYIVVGADDGGKPSGMLLPEHVALFDEAIVRKMLQRYLPGLGDIRIGEHLLENQLYVLLVVLPNPAVPVVFAVEGSYQDKGQGGRLVTVFRDGDVFVRHGSSSERWSQADVVRILTRLRNQEKDTWRKEWAVEFKEIIGSAGAQRISAGPAKGFDWNLDEHTFEDVFLEQLRIRDQLPMKLFFEKLPRQLKQAQDRGRTDDLATMLDRIALMASFAVRLRHIKLLTRSLKCLIKSYESTGPIGHLEIGVRVIALGGLAVRVQNWRAVAAMGKMKSAIDKYRHIIHHAQNDAVWRQVQPAFENTGGWAAFPIIQMASQLVEQRAWLNPDREATDEQVLDSLCQFDVLALLKFTGQNHGAYAPNFGAFYRERTEPILKLLLTNTELRKAIFPYGDQSLAAKLREINTLASKFTRSGWEGYHYYDSAIEDLLSRFPP